MSDTRELIVAALVMLGVLALIGLIVGMALRHYIGGFIRTVEREAREQEESEEASSAEEKDGEPPDPRGRDDGRVP